MIKEIQTYTKKIFEKLKPIFLLVGMSLATVAIVILSNLFIEKPKVAVNSEFLISYLQANEESETMLVESDIDTSTPLEVVEIPSSGDSETLGVSTAGCEAKYLINSISICKTEQQINRQEEEKEDENGNMISPKATIFLSKVTAPLELFSGMNVIDSNRLIDKEDPIFKAGGEQIDETTANIMLPPGKQIDIYKPYKEDVQFGIEYILQFMGGGERDRQEGKMVVDKKNPNDCEDCNNSSNPTSEKSNKLSDFMQDSNFRYPGQKEKMKEDPPEIETCDGEDRFEWWTCNAVVICKMTVGQQLLALLQSMKEIFLPRTMSADSIILIMSSPFGAVEDCPDEFCTNSYLDVRMATTLPPSQDGRKKVYYLTECEAIIQGDPEPYVIPCAWDFTHLYAEKDFASVDNIPTIEEGMTDDEYNDFLLGGSFCRKEGDWVYLQ